MSRAFVSAITAAAIAASGCGGHAAPRACSTNVECPQDHLCHAGACVASTAPTPALASSAGQAYQTNTIVQFDASASTDADAGDRIVRYEWSLSNVSALCEPVILTSEGPVLEVVFPCPGDFDLSLVLTDTAGVRSAPATQRITVNLADEEAPPPPGAPTAKAGPPIEIGHACSGAPLACTLRDEAALTDVVLQADGWAADGGPVSFAWTCAKSSATPDAVLTVTDAGASNAKLAIETPGTRIAGDYACKVKVTDNKGLSAQAVQVVRVTNRPPTLATDLAAIHVAHWYDGQFRAAGSTPIVTAVVDPDGDPVSPIAFGATGASMRLVPRSDFADFDIAVSNAEVLIGPSAGRRIIATVDDVNGGRGTASWEIFVDDTPPQVLDKVQVVAVPHVFNPATSTYEASAELTTFWDPDGDPLHVVPTGHPFCTADGLDGGRVHVSCTAPHLAASSLGEFARAHTMTIAVTDQFAISPLVSTEVRIQNAAPTLQPQSARVSTPFVEGTECCAKDPEAPHLCDAYYVARNGGSGFASVAYVDPENDPVDVVVKSAGAVVQVLQCADGICAPFPVSLPAQSKACSNTPLATTYATATLDLFVDDGASAPAQSTLAVQGY